MEDWRRRETDSYRNAYVDLFIPRLASCLVRWHLVKSSWNPLEAEATSVNKSSWFQLIAQHDMRSESSESKDHNPLVISKTIEVVLMPYIVEVTFLNLT